MKILIVEDSATLRTLYEKRIGDWIGPQGFLDFATNGAQALAKLICSLDLPDVILLDLEMPVMCGVEFIRRSREVERARNIPILVLAGSEARLEEALEAGASGFLKKPFQGLNFKAALRDAGVLRPVVTR